LLKLCYYTEASSRVDWIRGEVRLALAHSRLKANVSGFQLSECQVALAARPLTMVCAEHTLNDDGIVQRGRRASDHPLPRDERYVAGSYMIDESYQRAVKLAAYVRGRCKCRLSSRSSVLARCHNQVA
jgi:hypothetical protein